MVWITTTTAGDIDVYYMLSNEEEMMIVNFESFGIELPPVT